MGEIRFVGTGETRGYPYPVCKNSNSCSFIQPSSKYHRIAATKNRAAAWVIHITKYPNDIRVNLLNS